ncbi:MAG: VWA domain-containing protein [Rikenellaceae bacterium]
MFRFADPQYLYLLFIVPVLIAFFIYMVHRHNVRLARFGDLELIKPLMKEASLARVKSKFIFLITAIVFVIIAIARPQLGAKLKEVKSNGVEIMLAVDVSNSMLAEDFKPSRLERTKFAINRLLDKFATDRVGLIVFAGDAYVQLPITSDVMSAKNFVNGVKPNMVSMQGTSISKALELAGRSFSSQSDKSRAVILISDGENHEDNPLPVAKSLAEKGVTVHTIGIGTPEGSIISIDGEVMKDENGELVVTKLDEAMLKELAVTTNGSYIRANNQSMGLEEIVKQIHAMESKEFNTMTFEEYNEQFQYVLLAGFILLLIEFIILERKNRIIERMTLFNKEGDSK